MRAKQTFALTNIIGVEKSECIITKRCTRQPVLNAKRNVMFHSSQTVQDQYTAESATGNVDHQTDIKQTILLRFNRLFLFCLEFCPRVILLVGSKGQKPILLGLLHLSVNLFFKPVHSAMNALLCA